MEISRPRLVLVIFIRICDFAPRSILFLLDLLKVRGVTMDVNVSPNGSGADVSVSGSTDSGFSGSATIHVPSGDVGSVGVGASGSAGHIKVNHNFDSNRSQVNVGNADNSVRGGVGFDHNTNQPSVGVSVNLNW